MQNWDRLRVFAAVAREGSVSAASDLLGVTAPAVTQQLRKLEHEFHTPLVAPRGRGIALTAAGHRVAALAKDIEDGLGVLDHDLADLAHEVAGPLEIGTPMSIAGSLLLPALRRLATAHPRVRPYVCDGEAESFIRRLSAYTLDAAIVERWPVDGFAVGRNFEATTLVREPVAFVVPGGLDVPDTTAEAVAVLAHRPWIVSPVGSGAGDTLRWIFKSHGHRVDIAHLVSSYTDQLQFVVAGLACALVPRSALVDAGSATPDGIQILPVDTGIVREISVVTRAGEQSPAVEALLAELRRPA